MGICDVEVFPAQRPVEGGNIDGRVGHVNQVLPGTVGGGQEGGAIRVCQILRYALNQADPVQQQTDSLSF